MRRIHPFVYGHVIGALVTGLVAGAPLDATAVLAFSGILAVNAVIGSLVCGGDPASRPPAGSFGSWRRSPIR